MIPNKSESNLRMVDRVVAIIICIVVGPIAALVFVAVCDIDATLWYTAASGITAGLIVGVVVPRVGLAIARLMSWFYPLS